MAKPTTNRNGDFLWALHSLTHSWKFAFYGLPLFAYSTETRRPTYLYEFSFTHWCTQTHTLTHPNISSHFQYTTLFGCQDVKISCAFSEFSNSSRWRSLFRSVSLSLSPSHCWYETIAMYAVKKFKMIERRSAKVYCSRILHFIHIKYSMYIDKFIDET